MKAGDKIEFLSDQQAQKGPSTGYIKTSYGKQILVTHSDASGELFCVDDLMVERKAEHHKGGTLWVCT